MALKSRYSPLSKPNFTNIYNAFVMMTPREQLIAAIVGGLLIVILVIMPLSMVSGKVSSLKKGISKSQAKLQDVLDKVGEYQQLQTEIKALEKKYGRGISSMTSTVETLTRKVGLDTTIEVLKEKPLAPGDRFSELPVDLKLKNATLKKLIDLIYEIESYPTAVLRIRNMQIKPRYSNRAFMQVSMDIANVKIAEEKS